MDLLYCSLQSCRQGPLCHQYIIDAQFIRDHLCIIMYFRPKHTYNLCHVLFEFNFLFSLINSLIFDFLLVVFAKLKVFSSDGRFQLGLIAAVFIYVQLFSYFFFIIYVDK